MGKQFEKVILPPPTLRRKDKEVWGWNSVKPSQRTMGPEAGNTATGENGALHLQLLSPRGNTGHQDREGGQKPTPFPI